MLAPDNNIKTYNGHLTWWDSAPSEDFSSPCSFHNHCCKEEGDRVLLLLCCTQDIERRHFCCAGWCCSHALWHRLAASCSGNALLTHLIVCPLCSVKHSMWTVLACIARLRSSCGAWPCRFDNGITGGVTSMEPFLAKFFPDVYAHVQNPDDGSNAYCKYNNQGLQLFTS